MRLQSAVLAVLALAALSGGGASALAASPSPSPTAVEPVPPDEARFFAWLDRPLPTDAPAGTSISVGAYITDLAGGAGLSGTSLQARLHSAFADGDVTMAPAVEDWPGHVVATLVVPTGAIGYADFVLPGSSCNASGCVTTDLVIPVSGIGPPPDVALTKLATAFVDAPTQIVPVGVEAPIGFSIRPRVDWPAPGLVLPDRLWVQVRIPQAESLGDVIAIQDRPGHYVAVVNLPAAGDYVVQVATAERGTGTDLFSTGIRRITAAIEGIASLLPSPPVDAGGEPRAQLPGWVTPAVAIGAIVAILLAVLGRRPDGTTPTG